MKYLKTYESLNVPEIGDYVICKDNTVLHHNNQHYKNSTNLQFLDFISTHVGQIVKIDVSHEFFVRYDDDPPINLMDYAFYEKNRSIIWDIKSAKIIYDKYTNITSFKKEEILYWSKDKKEVEAMIEGDKYNL